MTFEVRQIDAYSPEDGLWQYNNVYPIGTFKTEAKDEDRAFVGYLRRHHGIVFKKSRTKIEFDGDNYTIVDRSTGEPLFDAIPIPVARKVG